MPKLIIISNIQPKESFSAGCWNVGGPEYDC